MASSSSIVAPGLLAPKIKSFIGTIKESIVDKSSSNNDIDLTTYYKTLLCMELLQRGILVDPITTSSSTLLQGISNTAGKVLLSSDTSNNIPKPLLAGSAVIAGRIAELCYQKIRSNATLSSSSSSKENPLGKIFDTKVLQTIIERCKVVFDIRFASLLKLSTLGIYDIGSDISSVKTSNNTMGIIGTVVSYRLLIISESYYYRATQYQPDAPPMYKKICDLILDQQQLLLLGPADEQQQLALIPTTTTTSWMATTAISNLIRIAQMKDNTKRVVELLLKLIESYLDNIINNFSSSNNNKSNTWIDNDLIQAFLKQYRPISPLPMNIASQKAYETLQQLDTILQSSSSSSIDLLLLSSESDTLLYHIVKYRVYNAIEESTIQDNTDYEYKKAQNRVAEPTIPTTRKTINNKVPQKPISIEGCYQQCQQQYFIQIVLDDDTNNDSNNNNNNNNSNLLTTSAIQLRDILLSELTKQQSPTSTTSDNNNTDAATIIIYQQYGWDLIAMYIQRLKLIAKVISVHNNKSSSNKSKTVLTVINDIATVQCWNKLLQFIIPVHEAIQKIVDGQQQLNPNWISSFLCQSQIQTLEISCMEILSAQWMIYHADTATTGSSEESTINPTLLRFISGIIRLLMKKRNEDKKQQQQLQSTNNSTDANNNVISSKSNENDITLKRLEVSLVTCDALILLQSDPSTDGSIFQQQQQDRMIRTISEMAMKRTERWNETTYAALAGEFGFVFLELLLCWSGFHKVPWLFCTLPEARTLIQRARQCLANAVTNWGRRSSSILHNVEEIIITLAEADAEGGYFESDLSSLAYTKYQEVLQYTETLSDPVSRDILVAQCCIGLSKLNYKQHTSLTGNENDHNTRKALELCLNINTTEQIHRPFLFWRSDNFVQTILKIQIATSRQLMAESLLQDGSVIEARKLLEDAIEEAPDDATTSFAYGSLLLFLFFFDGDKTPEKSKEAQVQLLRSAKLDSTKASPFALLGYWYEYHSDMKRAVGCYSKALTLDPTHPVAGRGLIRLVTNRDSIQPVLDKAIDIVSANNGWAWRAIGYYKCNVDGDDEMGVVALLKALRCKDIEQQQHDTGRLAAFFANPQTPMLPNRNEVVTTLTDIAICYRRLGRFTASIRSFHTAIEESKDNVTSFLLCQCAQVELELGLYEDAADKFTQALHLDDDIMRTGATYGQGIALLSLAKREIDDSKLGSAYALIIRAIKECEKVENTKFNCIQKLLGDLYTLGSLLPSELFDSSSSESERDERGALTLRLSFIENGERAYRRAASIDAQSTENENVNELQSSLITDIASNILLRAQILSRENNKGIHANSSIASMELYQGAQNEFRRAIGLCPTYAPAWCGFGCSVATSDPLLAQHCFCRCLELDLISPDSYSNLGFLCTAHRALSASESVSQALTEITDTPMLWMNLALMIEQKALTSLHENEWIQWKHQAADAYRASLQVTRHPVALSGLAMACRVAPKEKCSEKKIRRDLSSGKECWFLVTEYLGLYGTSEIPSVIFEGALAIEVGHKALMLGTATRDLSNDVIDLGQKAIQTSLESFEMKFRGDDSKRLLGIDLIGNLNSEASSSVTLSENIAATNFHSHCSSSDSRLDRQIINNPNKGELWVKLAKQYARKVLKKPSSPVNNESIENAKVAADRGVDILLKQFSEKKAVDGNNIVCARHLAEGFALRYWIDSIQSNNGNSDKFRLSNTINLQRSMIIDPGNKLAQAAKNILMQ